MCVFSSVARGSNYPLAIGRKNKACRKVTKPPNLGEFLVILTFCHIFLPHASWAKNRWKVSWFFKVSCSTSPAVWCNSYPARKGTWFHGVEQTVSERTPKFLDQRWVRGFHYPTKGNDLTGITTCATPQEQEYSRNMSWDLPRGVGVRPCDVSVAYPHRREVGSVTYQKKNRVAHPSWNRWPKESSASWNIVEVERYS